MELESAIKIAAPRKFIGLRMRMSLADNKTRELWKAFMNRKGEIENSIGRDLYSINIYDSEYYTSFSPSREFEKWAAIPVGNFRNIPEGMESLELPEGLYAVFQHKGGPLKAPQTFQYIFSIWFPASGYELDDRPHFEVLGKKYKNDDPESEEEIWVPVRKK